MESHIRYLKEVRAPALMEVGSLVLGSDAKRLRFAHVMQVNGVERATFECLLLHVDTNAGRTAPMPDHVQAALEAAEGAEMPDWAGRGISLGKR